MPRLASWARAAESAIVAKAVRPGLRGCPAPDRGLPFVPPPRRVQLYPGCGDPRPTEPNSPCNVELSCASLAKGWPLPSGIRLAELPP